MKFEDFRPESMPAGSWRISRPLCRIFSGFARSHRWHWGCIARWRSAKNHRGGGEGSVRVNSLEIMRGKEIEIYIERERERERERARTRHRERSDLPQPILLQADASAIVRALCDSASADAWAGRCFGNQTCCNSCLSECLYKPMFRQSSMPEC